MKAKYIDPKAVDRTRAMLSKWDGSLNELADLADVGRQWLVKFNRGGFPEPGFSKLAKLHNFLVDHRKSA